MIGTLWNALFYQPIMNGLLLLYGLFGNNLGLAIIALTIILRVVLFPLMRSQYESSKKLRSLQPMMEQLKKKYARNPQKMQKEQVALYKKIGYNPLGCLFSTLLPFPFLIAIYQAIRAFSGGNEITGVYQFVANFLHADGAIVIKTMFFGLDLSKAYRPIAADSGYLSAQALPYLVIVLVVAISQYFSGKYQQKLMGAGPSVEKKKDDDGKNQKDGKAAPADMGGMMNDMSKSMQFTFPVMIGIISLDLPAAVSLYWILQSWLPVWLNQLYDKFKTKA
jgi:YidC/Oxa1 family membrane protein insertase